MVRKISLLGLLIMLSNIASAQYRDYYTEGNEFMNQQKFALAEEIYGLGIEDDSSLHVLYPSLANAMMMQGKHNKADSVLDVVLEKNASLIGALWFKGLNYFKWGQDSMSIVYIKKYLNKANPANNRVVEAYYYVGRAYEVRLSKNGLTQTELSDMIAYYEKFIIKSEGHPLASSKKIFIAKIKAQKPNNYTGKWVYKTAPKKK